MYIYIYREREKEREIHTYIHVIYIHLYYQGKIYSDSRAGAADVRGSREDTMLCYAMLCYTILYYTILCYAAARRAARWIGWRRDRLAEERPTPV